MFVCRLNLYRCQMLCWRIHIGTSADGLIRDQEKCLSYAGAPWIRIIGGIHLSLLISPGLQFWIVSFSNRSRDSAVGIATDYGLDHRGVWIRVPAGSRILCSPCRSNRPYTMGNWSIFPGIKYPGREAYHWSPSSVDVKKTWICTSTSPYQIIELYHIFWRI
jgi:hypothetical protein